MGDMEVETSMDQTQSDDKSNSIDLATIIKYRLAKGLSFGEIAEMTGVPKSTIHSKFQTFLKYCNPEAVESWEDKKASLLSSAEMVIYEKMMDEDTLKKASFNNLAYGLTQVNNINRLHRGQATENIGYMDYNRALDQLIAERNRLAADLGLDDQDTDPT